MLATQPIAEAANYSAGDLLPVLLHAFNDRVVVLDEHGIITHANDAWIRSAIENGAHDVSCFGVGADYLGICERAAAEGSQEARAAADAIHAVLAGKAESFVTEHTSSFVTGTRHFRTIVLPVHSPVRGAVVAHIDITDARESARARERHVRLSGLLQEVTAAANEALAFDTALKQTLARICSTFGWQAAHAFIVPEREVILLPTGVWHLEQPSALQRLLHVRTEPLAFSLTSERIAVHSLKSIQAPRAILAHELGLSYVVNLTVPAGLHPGGLIEFFSSGSVTLDEDERETLTNVAAHLGRVLERERHMSALLRSEAKFRGVFESNAVPMYFWNADKMILDANDALLRLLGYTRQEMERGELCCTNITPPEQQPMDTEAIKQLQQTGHCEPYEKNWIRRDGVVLNVVLGGALLPGSKSVGTAVALDITELRRTSSALRESERRYKLATSSAAISIWELDMRSSVVYSDGVLSGLLGYPRDERVTHETWIARIHHADRERVLQHEQLVLASTQRLPDGSTPIPEIEFRVLHHNGSVRWFLNRGLVLRDAEDRPYRAIGAVTDITEQKRAQRTLRINEYRLRATYARVRALTGRLITAQEEERRRIAREIHDDVGQRLAALSISIAHIKQRSTGHAELFAATEKQVDELAKAIRDISHNLHSAVLEHVGLEPALQSLAEEVRSTGTMNVSLTLTPLPEHLPQPVSLAAFRIVQEALRNVHKHSGAAAAKVYVNTNSSALMIRVCDDGCGFNPNARRLNLGLGLISAEERARSVGGSLRISSSPGQGTRLWAILPLGTGVDCEAA